MYGLQFIKPRALSSFDERLVIAGRRVTRPTHPADGPGHSIKRPDCSTMAHLSFNATGQRLINESLANRISYRIQLASV